ncbi:uncharacterized protein LOC107367259 [Tetranychus urticae]|uniref:Uncharacterized protein n=1 Tax=Tetranychus urticae TaxID=32264 RepID=T1KTS1_TETUR|nr:uncharacterized protein LOC107367259 [Tetranychus urticae]
MNVRMLCEKHLLSKDAPWSQFDVFKRNKFNETLLHPRGSIGFKKLIEDTKFANDFVKLFNEYFGANLCSSFVKTRVYPQMALAVFLTKDNNIIAIDFREEFSTKDLLIYNSGQCSSIVLNTAINFGVDEQLTLAIEDKKNGLKRLKTFRSSHKIQLNFINKEKLVDTNHAFYKLVNAVCHPEHFLSDQLDANYSGPLFTYMKENLHISKCWIQLLDEQKLEMKKNEKHYQSMVLIGEYKNFI